MSEHGQSADEPKLRPATLSDLYPGRFLKGEQLQREVTVKITDVYRQKLRSSDGVEAKVILTFERSSDGPTELVLAKINAVCLAAMFSSKRAAWVGKRVTLFGSTSIMPMPSGPSRGKACIRVCGSPDITEEIEVTFAPPRRRPVVMTMRVTSATNAARAPKPAAQPATAPRESAEKDDEPDWPNEGDLPPGAP